TRHPTRQSLAGIGPNDQGKIGLWTESEPTPRAGVYVARTTYGQCPMERPISPRSTRSGSRRVYRTPAPGAATRSSFISRPDRACSVSARVHTSSLWSYKLRKVSRPMSPRPSRQTTRARRPRRAGRSSSAGRPPLLAGREWLGHAPSEITHRDHPNYRIAIHHGEMPESSEQHPVERLSRRRISLRSSPDLGTSIWRPVRPWPDRAGGVSARPQDVSLGEDAHPDTKHRPHHHVAASRADPDHAGGLGSEQPIQ